MSHSEERTLAKTHVHPIFQPVLRAIAGEITHQKWSRLNLTDEAGRKYVWRYRRERFDKGFFWTLETHEGTVRVLESNWNGSVPRIRLIAENYGLTLKEALS